MGHHRGYREGVPPLEPCGRPARGLEQRCQSAADASPRAPACRHALSVRYCEHAHLWDNNLRMDTHVRWFIAAPIRHTDAFGQYTVRLLHMSHRAPWQALKGNYCGDR